MQTLSARKAFLPNLHQGKRFWSKINATIVQFHNLDEQVTAQKTIKIKEQRQEYWQHQ
jgi:hypothetical protein